MSTSTKFVPADTENLEYSDYAELNFPADPACPVHKTARMLRPLYSSKGYNWDAPGARLRFRTNAAAVTVHLTYSNKHVSDSGRNPVGIYLIDGKTSPKWTFRSISERILRPVEHVDLGLAVPGDRKEHTYEIIMPYGDSVDVAGLTVNQDAEFGVPEPRPAFRCVMYGDSVTQGFTASSIAATYAFQLARQNNWQLINMAIGGLASNPHDGAVIGKINCNLLLVLMGVNDWQGGRPVDVYRKNMYDFLRNFRKIQKTTPVYLITPLWVPPVWRPKAAAFKLEAYRQVLRELVETINDPNLKLLEGPALIDHDEKYFDAVAVHPNDAGFKMMAKRLACIPFHLDRRTRMP